MVLLCEMTEMAQHPGLHTAAEYAAAHQHVLDDELLVRGRRRTRVRVGVRVRVRISVRLRLGLGLRVRARVRTSSVSRTNETPTSP